MRAVVSVAFSREARVEVQSSLARQTWVMEERERLEARRCGISDSRGEGEEEEEEEVAAAEGSLGPGGGEGGWTEEVGEAMV